MILVGALLALCGCGGGSTWELFLQMQLHGHVITAPFTLRVAS